MRGRGPRARPTERKREGHLKQRSAQWREVGEAEVKRDRPSLLQRPRLVQSGTARLLLHAPRGRTTNVDTTTLGPVRRYARGPNFEREPRKTPGYSPSITHRRVASSSVDRDEILDSCTGKSCKAKVSCPFDVLNTISSQICSELDSFLCHSSTIGSRLCSDVEFKCVATLRSVFFNNSCSG